MDRNQLEQVKNIITTIIRHNLSPDAWTWLVEKCANRDQSAQQLNIAFASIPRKIGRAVINYTPHQAEEDDTTRLNENKC